ncbi:MAG: ATP-grasp domain-containing protein [Syntrophomonadaceae bacterium]|nr:ATP-grasp domain-containing protein [Syntrophomonadaceae bacterium]
MQAILFLGTLKSGSSRDALRAAKKMGYYVILFTDRRSHLEQSNDFTEVDSMLPCNLRDLQEIRLNIVKIQMRDIKVCAIVSFTEAHCLTACIMADEFGLHQFTCHAIKQMKNKIISREILSLTDYSPRFMAISASAALSDIEPLLGFPYPFVIKSPSSTGSANVFKINNRQELNYYLRHLQNKRPSESILVEEMLEGPQYLIEVLVHEKNVLIAAIIEQEVTFYQRFIITGYNLLLELPEKLQDLPGAVAAIVKAHGMETGACHLEMRLVNQQWKLIEINPRISGGAMNKLIYLGLGVELTAETIKLALGQQPDLSPRYRRHIFVQYRIVAQGGILDKVTGMNRATKSAGVLEVFVRPRRGAYLRPPLSMLDRYAYVIATGASEDEARSNAKAAAMKIQFWMRSSIDEANKSNVSETIRMPNPHNSVGFQHHF